MKMFFTMIAIAVFYLLTADLAVGAEKVRGDVFYKRDLEGGVELYSGTGSLLALRAGWLWNRNRMWVDEWSFRGRLDWALIDGEVLRERAETELRYGWSITKALYHFVSASVEYDKILELDCGILPASGIGFWWSDTPMWKVLNEVGVGARYRFLWSGRDLDPILHSLFRLVWQPNDQFSLVETLGYYPSEWDFSEFSLRNEFTVNVKVLKHLDLKTGIETGCDTEHEGVDYFWEHRVVLGFRIMF